MSQVRIASESMPFIRVSAAVSYMQSTNWSLSANVPGDKAYQEFLDNTVYNLDETSDGGVLLDVELLKTLSINPGTGDDIPLVFSGQLKNIYDANTSLVKVVPPDGPPSKEVFEASLEQWMSDNLDGLYIHYEDMKTFVSSIAKDSGDVARYMEDLVGGISGDDKLTTGTANDFHMREINIIASPTLEIVKPYVEPSIKSYTADSLSRRRPPGDHVYIEMIAPSEVMGSPVREDIKWTNGSTINSVMLNMSPESLVINTAKKINRVQTMTRWMEEHWGDEIDQVSFSGNTFAFIKFPGVGETDGGGLCVESRSMTAPYQELQHLVNIYQTNGCVYQEEPLSDKETPRTFFNFADPSRPFYNRRHPRAGFMKYRLYIRMRCDYAEFVGFFDSFDVVEDSNSPFKMSYNLSFKSEFTRWL
jgi:hypothetical protein